MRPFLKSVLAAILFLAVTCPAFAAKGPQPTICDRACWGARSSSASSQMSGLTRAIIHHTAASSHFNTTSIETSKANVRGIQNYHMDSQGWGDIGYHFLVDKLGNTFEGRLGSMTTLPRGAHDGNNYNSFGFNAMGYFHTPYNQVPPVIMRSALYNVIAWRMPSTWSPYGSGSYNSATVGFLDGHRKVKATACPGDLFHNPYIGSDYNGGEARNGVNERKNAPTAPTSLQANAISTSQVNLSWTDNSGVETGFKVERATASGGPWTQIATPAANATSYSSTGLSGNTVYYYRIRSYSALGNSVYSNTANATTPGVGPSITGQPQTQSKDPGTTATFSVTATGTGTLTYQWRRNGTNLLSGGRVTGATSATLSISAVEATDAGIYSVRVADTLGTNNSADANLFLNAVLVFEDTFESGNLNNWTIVAGATTLSITTTNNHTSGGTRSAMLDITTDKMYRNVGFEAQGRARVTFWMYDNMGSQTRWYAEARSYSGAGYNDGTLQQLFAIGRYSVSFGTNNTGTLEDEAVNTAKYQGRVVYGVNTGWFNLSATRTLGWHKFEIERAANGTSINFYVDGTLDKTITQTTFATWDSVVIGSLGSSTTTGNAWFDDIKIEYLDPPSILTAPTNRTANPGASTTFSVIATNNVEGYQWRFNGVDIAGATGSSYTRSSLDADDGGPYSVKVINRAGTVVSGNATLTVTTPPSIVEQPDDIAVQSSSNATFSVIASGTSPFSYQWRFNTQVIPGATNSSYTRSGVQTNDAGAYSVVVTNVAGTITSADAFLTIITPQPPEFGEISMVPGGVRMLLLGEPGAQYSIEVSTNLTVWSPLTNITLTEESYEIVEPTEDGQKFYRAIRP